MRIEDLGISSRALKLSKILTSLGYDVKYVMKSSSGVSENEILISLEIQIDRDCGDKKSSLI